MAWNPPKPACSLLATQRCYVLCGASEVADHSIALCINALTPLNCGLEDLGGTGWQEGTP